MGTWEVISLTMSHQLNLAELSHGDDIKFDEPQLI